MRYFTAQLKNGLVYYQQNTQKMEAAQQLLKQHKTSQAIETMQDVDLLSVRVAEKLGEIMHRPVRFIGQTTRGMARLGNFMFDPMKLRTPKQQAAFYAERAENMQQLITQLEHATPQEIYDFTAGLIADSIALSAAQKACAAVRASEAASVASSSVEINPAVAVAEKEGITAARVALQEQAAAHGIKITEVGVQTTEVAASSSSSSVASVTETTGTYTAAVEETAGRTGKLREQLSNNTVNKDINAIFKDGYYEVNGFKFSKYYYERLWEKGRQAPTLRAKEILDKANHIISDAKKTGFMRYEFDGWEMIYNPQTKEVWHLSPVKNKGI